MKKVSTTEQFIVKARKIHGDKYNYSKSNYTGVYNNIEIICSKHGSFSQRPNDHLNKCGCPSCGIESRKKYTVMTLDKFIKKSNNVHNNKYDYSKIKKFNYKVKTPIICPNHGIFYQIPNSHLNGRGCPKCIGRNNTIIEIIFEFEKVHNNKYNYELIDLNKEIKKADYIDIICPNHGKFKQRIDCHLLGQGCPECKESSGEKKVKTFLKQNLIKFHAQYKFEDCIFKRHLSFDFYLPDFRICIEYDGRQHFKINNFFWW